MGSLVQGSGDNTGNIVEYWSGSRHFALFSRLRESVRNGESEISARGLKPLIVGSDNGMRVRVSEIEYELTEDLSSWNVWIL